MSDVNNLLLIAKIFFEAATAVIRALERLIDLTRPHLDHADRFNVVRDQISVHASNETVHATGSKRLNWSEMKADGPTITNETAV